MLAPATAPLRIVRVTLHDLPVELILGIFTYVAHFAFSSPRRRFVTTSKAHQCQWAGLMLVCRRWRGIILNTAPFWTAIDFTDNPNWVKLCLKRSGRVPIDVCLLGPSSTALKAALPLLLAAKSRIRSFTFESYLETLNYAALKEFFGAACMPLLENLSVTVSTPWHFEQDLGLSALLKDLRLRSLDLTGLTLPMDPAAYANLTSLGLHSSKQRPNGTSLPDLLRILRAAASHLQEVDLSNLYIPSPPSDVVDDTTHPTNTPIRFPKLRSFYMHNDHTTASRVLGMLDIPACIRFHLRVGAEHQDFLPVLRKLIPQNIRHLLDGSATLTITMDEDTYTITDPGPRRPRSAYDGEAHVDRVHISIVRAYEPAADDIVRVVNLAQLTSLTVCLPGLPRVMIDAWRALLSACPVLRRLDVSGRIPMADLFVALSPSAATEAPCSALHVLSVAVYDGDGKVVIGDVLSCVRARGSQASRLSSLSLRGHNGNEGNVAQDLRALRSLVDVLIVL